METSKQQERPAAVMESFGGERSCRQAAMAASAARTLSCCGDDYFLKAPAAPFAIPPPDRKVTSAAEEEEGSRVGDKKLESFEFGKNQNLDQGSGRNGGIKNRSPGMPHAY